MRHDSLFLQAIGTDIPPSESTQDAIAAGYYEESAQEEDLQLSAAVGPIAKPAVDYAVTAGARALTASGINGRQIGLHLHATVRPHSDVWNSVSYVQNSIEGINAMGVQIRAASNGALIGLELAASHLTARPGLNSVLITASDTWHRPEFDRWSSDRGLVFGDGGAAAIVGPSNGIAQILSLVTVADSRWEGIHRERGTALDKPSAPIDLQRRALDFFADREGVLARNEFVTTNTGAIRRAVKEALEDAQVGANQIAMVVTPFFGRRLVLRQCLDPISWPIEHTTHHLAATIGHLGAADQLVGLDSAIRSSPAGSHILVLGVGAGFSWSAAVLQVHEMVSR